jgi:membrane protease YdiL (CAAX protease family)
MRAILLGADGRLRNGWWVALFVLLFLASRALYRPLADALRGLGAADAWLSPLQIALLLGVTWACVRLRRESLATVGLRLDRRWVAESGAGLLLGAVSALLAVAIMAAVGAVRLELDPARNLYALAGGFYVFACVALLEELLFRGFVFQRLVAGLGAWTAQGLLALTFALAHWGNPDMQGDARVLATIEIALGAILLGLAWLRTRSLALPVGLHLGWNWAQGQILGFDVSGLEQPGWWRPVFDGAPDWLTGGEFGLEASVCAIAVDVLMIVLLWRWKGRGASHAATSVMSATAACARA